MKVEHLRIGNIAYVLDEDFAKTSLKVDLNDLCNIDCNPELYEPIPLNEEWLIKFGFEGELLDYTLGKLNVCLKNPRGIYKRGRTYYNCWAILEKQPEYVHELQNLFFVLTGEELLIK